MSYMPIDKKASCDSGECIICNELDWSDPRWCPSCGGEVHEHFGDEDRDCNFWTEKHCHNCGEKFDGDEFSELLKIESA